MKKKIFKITASLFLSVTIAGFTLAASLCPVVNAEYISQIPYYHYDESVLDNMLSEFSEACLKDNNDSAVEELYNKLINEYDEIFTQYSFSSINYDSMPSNEDYWNEYKYMSELVESSWNLIAGVFSEELNNSGYSALLKSIMGEYSDYIIAFRLPDESQSSRSEEIYNEYCTVKASDLSEEEKSLKIAQLYLDLANYLNSTSSTGNYLDDAYDSYLREYTRTDINNLSKSIIDSTQDIIRYTNKKISDLTCSKSTQYSGNPFLVVDKYSSLVSDELNKSSNFLLNNNLYKLAPSGTSSGVTYTTLLPSYKSPYIFETVDDSIFDVQSAIHEFGHFNNSMHLNIPAFYIFSQNLDIAETQSQGLEMLYTQFYDDIFPENAVFQKLVNVSLSVATLSDGFKVNQFENAVFSNASTLTAQDVVDLYNNLTQQYGLQTVEFYYISHLFSSPGYYISYSVSMLAALDILKISNDESFDTAAKVYTDVSHLSPYNSDISFTDALEDCGFDNVLSDEYINSLVISINDYSCRQCGQIPGDVNDNGTFSASDLVLIEKIIVDTEYTYYKAQKERADLNYDGSVDAYDIVTAVTKLLK